MRQVHAISLEGLKCRRGRHELLRDVTLDVQVGQMVLIVGPNGSGKTTLLRALAGLERPAGGRGTIADHDILRSPVQVRRATGYVPELPAFEYELSVQEQLTLHARLAGLGPPEARAAVASMLELLDLADLKGRTPQTLSRGQRQRMAIGRALVYDPAVLLLDEPLVALDEVGQAELTEVLEELRELGKTVVMASRVPGPLLDIVDAAYTLSDGALVAVDGTSPSAGVRLRLTVLADGEQVRAWLADMDGVSDVRLEEPGDVPGLTRLSAALASPDQSAVARIVRSIVESGGPVVEVYSMPEEVQVA